MTEPENSAKNFLRRWSKRKHAAEAGRSGGTARHHIHTDTQAPSPTSPYDDSRQPPFDLASLPPIESITATSDISPFLAPGVPEHLTRAALRRLWVIDPMIRNFIGLAENQWDFTKPGGMPGFESLKFTAAVRSMVASLINEVPSPPALPQQSARQEQSTATQTSQLATPIGPNHSATSARQPDCDEVVAADCQNLNRGTAPHPNDDVAAQNGSESQNSRESNTTLRSAPRKHGGALPR